MVWLLVKYFSKIHIVEVFYLFQKKRNFRRRNLFFIKRIKQRLNCLLQALSNSFRKEEVHFPEILFLEISLLEAFLLMICTYVVTKAFILMLVHFFKIWSFNFSVRSLLQTSFVSVPQVLNERVGIYLIQYNFFNIFTTVSYQEIDG